MVTKAGCFSNAVISGVRRDIDDLCSPLGYYAMSFDNCLPTFRDDVSGPSSKGQEIFFDFLTFEDGADTLSRNVGEQLPHHAA
jgi:hypothetical protein